MRRRLLRIGLAIWGLVMLAIGALLTARHELALPTPNDDDASQVARALGLPNDTWHTVHVLYAECRCSRRIVDHLEARGPTPTFAEQVLLVGDRDEMRSRLERRGFVVRPTTRSELRDVYRIEGAPLLLVLDASGAARYAGGYTATKQGADIRDVDIMTRLLHAEPAPKLPLAGCAVSDRLRSYLDPGGLL